MRDVNPPDRDSSEDDDLERSLERGLHCQPLSTEAFERIRANLLVEFRQQNASAARQPRIRRYVAIAAAACALAIGVLLVRSYLSSDAVVARLETEILQRGLLGRDVAMHVAAGRVVLGPDASCPFSGMV